MVVTVVVVDSRPHQWVLQGFVAVVVMVSHEHSHLGWVMVAGAQKQETGLGGRWDGNIRCWEAEMVGGEMTQQIHGGGGWLVCSGGRLCTLVEGWCTITGGR